ncbi:CCA tRNA nucleotidyltransferase [Persicirhabdus sediminis]|uniref:CCA tRNA nucleotidyltransferase n=1 Tax=Persicirhabdus sediminis TaxID=454144 RepID=A0A8J7SJ61_9BACT|nr:CCA tRNA nucleotidyltransferase [Persicirhabdus sediminis]MBK1791925.1 CCA tRNA nucleotidyltransferase [Persicirhabdus sediminis]
MPDLLHIARSVSQTLIDAGHTTYFAGGCVRDALLQTEPKDYDIASSASPAEIEALFEKTNNVGAHFGVMLVREQKNSFEIARFRTDGSYSDGRRPESVTFASPEEDAQRRDFTINGLFQHPLTGEIIDYVDGQVDLKKQLIRAIGDPAQRFQEDALRLMRAIRFATVLDFAIEPATWQAICDHAQLLEKISTERIRDEFSKIMLSPHPRLGIQLMVDSGLMRYVIPEVYDLIGCEQPPQWHPEGDVFTHTMIMLEMMMENPSLELALAVLLHDIGKPATYTYDEENQRIRFNGHDKVGAEMAEEILRRLRYSNATIEAATAMVDNHMNFMHVQQMRTAKVKKFMSRPNFEDEMELHRVDCASSNGFTDNYEFLREKEAEFAAEPLIPPPLLTGKDLIDRQLAPGPQFKDILNQAQTLQLEGSLSDRDQALSWLDEFLSQ